MAKKIPLFEHDIPFNNKTKVIRIDLPKKHYR